MNTRRTFLAGLGALGAAIGWVVPRPAVARRSERLLQTCPLAGFQYHAGPTVWDRLRVGDELLLVREPDNPYDARAVAVHWRGHRLGYLPRLDNAAASQLLDRGETLSARITHLQAHGGPWQRVHLAVYWQSTWGA